MGFAKGSLGGLCCEHCEVDGYGGDGGDGVAVWRIRGSDAEVGCVNLGFGVWGLVISKVISGL